MTCGFLGSSGALVDFLGFSSLTTNSFTSLSGGGTSLGGVALGIGGAAGDSSFGDCCGEGVWDSSFFC